MAKTYYVSWPSTTTGNPGPNFGLTPTFITFNNAGSAVTPPSISAVSGATGIYSFTWGTTTPIAFVIDGFTTGLGTTRYITGSLDPADAINEIASTLIAISTSGLALGTTAVALGTSTVAFGQSLAALGSSQYALELLNFGLGTTSVALGTTSVSQNALELALGNSIYALGLTTYAYGVTTEAIATTLLATNSSLTVTVAGIGSTASSFGTQTTDPVDLYGYLKRILENLEGDNLYYKVSGSLNIYNRGSTTLLRQKSIANGVSTTTKTGV